MVLAWTNQKACRPVNTSIYVLGSGMLFAGGYSGITIDLEYQHYRKDLWNDWDFLCHVCSECYDSNVTTEVLKNNRANHWFFPSENISLFIYHLRLSWPDARTMENIMSSIKNAHFSFVYIAIGYTAKWNHKSVPNITQGSRVLLTGLKASIRF